MPVALKVACSSPENPYSEMDVVSKDISLGGIGLKTFAPVEVGKELDITIYRPFWGDPIRVRGKVVWSACDTPGEGAIGIEFTSVPWTQLTALVNSIAPR